ncbi:MAG: hypothetical protein PVJ67_01730 [Candidatus Pacearchaeota archaeon]
MNKGIIITCPGKGIYQGLSERKIAEVYTKMASDDFDKFVGFSESYANSEATENPDLEREIHEKEGRKIILGTFARQPLLNVGDVDARGFISSSYIFNPSYNSKNLWLPDLEVVSFRGENKNKLRDILYNMVEFYSGYNWNTIICNDFKNKEKFGFQIQNKNRGFAHARAPKLEAIAKRAESIGYDLEKLFFTQDKS